MLPKEHPSWFILDSSKIEDYIKCPRYYFYRNILGWRKEAESKDLIFGEAWHLAQETLLKKGYNQDAINEGYILAEACYRDAFPNPETDIERIPKIPAAIYAALPKYIEQFKEDREEVLYTEITGSVPIAKDKLLRFKMDSVLKNEEGKYLSRDHKTSSRNSDAWKDGFKMKFQFGTYQHVLHCLYKDVWGIEVNGAVFTKSKGVEYIRVPVRRTVEMMEVWLHSANYWYDRIMNDIDQLAIIGNRVAEDEKVMECFIQHTSNCTIYGTCMFMDFCLCWPNPLAQDLSIPPEGFREEYWDPRTLEEKSSNVMHLE